MKKTIIYIVSDDRSGSTLLENILSKSDSVISLGELHNLDSHVYKGKWGKEWNWNCSCGNSFRQCPFWSQVFSQLEKRGITKVKNTSIIPSKKFLRQRGANVGWEQTPRNIKTLDLLENLYDVVFSITKAQAIIDSSKRPFQGSAIYSNLTFDVKIIYLKRDIRAVTLSKLKWIQKRTGKTKNFYSTMLGTKLYNMKCRRFFESVEDKNKIAITYERLSKEPQQTIDSILYKFQLPSVMVPEYMYLEDDHTIGGTPNRFEKREIKYDRNWEAELEKKPLRRWLGKIIDNL